VNTIPNDTHWSFKSSSSELLAALSGLPLVTEPATIGLTFWGLRRQIADLANDELYESINFLEVSQSGQKLLEAFDGFIIITLSKHFPLAGTALTQYLNQDLLFISDNW
jgi:hypothetical protein